MIKLLHVSKYVFWNILVAFMLLTAGGDAIPRFYVTYIIMIILAFTLVLKIFLAIIYLIKYKCKSEKVKGNRYPDPD